MAPIFKNNASSRLYAAIDDITTSIRVQDGDGALFPQPSAVGDYFMITIEDRRTGQIEICRATGRSGDIINVVRGQEGTAAQDFEYGATVSNRITAGTLSEYFAFAYSKTEADSRYLSKLGGQMNGHILLLPDLPVNPDQAVSKKYVDLAVSSTPQTSVASSVSLVYDISSSGIDTINLMNPDIYGQTFILSDTDIEPVSVFVDGRKLVENNGAGVGEYTVDRVAGEILFDTAIPSGVFVSIDVYAPRDVVTGPVAVNLLAPVSPLPDGANTIFTLRRAIDNSLITATRSDEVMLYVNNVPQRPGTDYAVVGATCTFSEPPEADAQVWGVWIKTSLG